jgi:penicillin amidase
LLELGIEARWSTPDDLAQRLRADIVRWTAVIDRAGIPHIYAASARDGFFLQGYAVARDRLWQIDLWRKRGLGRLAASFGAAYVAQDRASRLLLYRGDMAREWAAYPAAAKGWTEAFVAGINAYVAEVEAGRQPLPVEFAGRQAPRAGGAVVGSREDAPAIERKCDSPKRAFVTVEGQKVAAAFRVPEVQTAIGTHPRDAGAVG